MFENPHTEAHRLRVRIYTPDLWNRIKPKPFSLPPPASTKASASASTAPATAAAAVTAPAAALCWEETTHKHYSVGQKVEIVGDFKPKYTEFIGSTAVIRKIYAKKINSCQFKDYIFFVEVIGKDDGETDKFHYMIRRLNHRSFTDFLAADDRYLLPCRASHIRFFIPGRWAQASSTSNGAAASNAASVRDEAPPHSQIQVGDSVEILKTLHCMKRFVGYHGVVRQMKQRESFTSCWIEIQYSPIGETVAPDLVEDIKKMNKDFYTEGEMWSSFVCCRLDNVVLADPKIPLPWTPETWAALSVQDRKMHRQKQQQDKDDAASKERGGKTKRRLEMPADSKDALDYPDVNVGDNVEILYVDPLAIICPLQNRQEHFVGFQGIIRKLERTSLYVEAYIQLERNTAGEPILKQQTKDIQTWNEFRYPYPVKENDPSWFRVPCNYIVLADPKLPDPWTPETWAALSISDRKMHRKQQQDLTPKNTQHAQAVRIGHTVQIRKTLQGYTRHANFVGFQGVVTSIMGLGCSEAANFYTTCFVDLKCDPRGQPVTHEQLKIIQEWNEGLYDKHQCSWMKCKTEYLVVMGETLPPTDNLSGAPVKKEKREHTPPPDIPRHIKYDLMAKPPWHGGEVKPYLYGRKVVFIHQGKRGEPITR